MTLVTSALKKIKRFNRNKLDVEMSQLLLSILDSRYSIAEISFTLSVADGGYTVH